MPRNIQIRRVPDRIHRALKVRAAQAGMTLSDFLLKEVTFIAERPTLDDVLERIRARPAVNVSTSSPAAVRAGRAARS